MPVFSKTGSKGMPCPKDSFPKGPIPQGIPLGGTPLEDPFGAERYGTFGKNRSSNFPLPSFSV